ncbi:BTAD domain-containing putative transcriptional regulator [Amycolatopsis sp. DG1A-15b]|uniref:AfsR/SARP family transcriptional regulator n=1 Tax=Amycolatopsis sp. DG1A-15b TaxID=3052846 RepID=UPI003342C18B
MLVVRLLGEVGAEVGGRPVDLGPPRQRCVLAALAVDAGRVVPVDRLVERVWGSDVAPRARATLHSYISRLRRALAGIDGVTIMRRSGGYVLVADTTEPVVDLHRFRQLCAAGDAEADDERAAVMLTDALKLWRGQALTGVDGEWIEAERDRLAREWSNAQHELTETRLRLGHGGQLVAELAELADAQPMDERVASQYLRALHEAGRTADALAHYQRVRVRLVEELGTDPSVVLQDLHRRILTSHPAPADASPPPAAGSRVPRELRAAPTSFVGRRGALHRLDADLDAARSSGTMMISAVTGTGGLGKTWLALRWAHRHLDRFPDGQLFVDLRGFGPDDLPMAPAAALRGFLTALGIDEGSIPPDAHTRSALFRSLTAKKRMLVVLDNAAGTDQIVPLLPGGESCAVVVTSRNRLAGLITTHDAGRVPLDVLSAGEARDLLTARLGTTRVDAARTAVDELVDLCGGLPLALSVIAGRAGAPLSTTVSELRQSGLDGLADDDPSASLPTVLSWSYRALTEEQAVTFGLLAGVPGPDAGLFTAANLTGLPPARTQAVLRGLEQASLLERDSRGRYRMHDLIRAYATGTARHLPDAVRDAALRRVLDYCAHTAFHAGLLLDAHRGPVEIAPPAPSTHVPSLPDTRAAMAWFISERATLLAAQQAAALQHRHDTVWWLALSSDTFHHRRGHRHDRLAVWRAAAHAATHLAHPAPRVIASRHLGRACAALGLREEAVEHLHHAIGLAEDHDKIYELAHAHQTLGRVLGQHDDHQALHHATRALHLFFDLDAPLCIAHGHNAVGWHTARLGDHDSAHGHFRAALTLHREQHNPAGEANSLDSLGYIEHARGNHHRAIDHYTQALTLRRSLGNAYDSASTLEHLGPPHVALGRPDQARTVWQEAQQLFRRQGRDRDAEHVQRQLDTLVGTDGYHSAEAAR